MPKKMKAEKDPFANLDSDFKDAILQGEETAVRAAASKVALDQEELMSAKEGDEDLKQAMAAASVASAVYREGTKMNKLRIKFIRSVLKSRGLE
jgi:hypothetical protein